MSKESKGAPEWVRGAIFYQIFPDRFDNGSQSNDPDTTKAWGSEPNFTDRMGGDLQGVRRRFDYLKDLGINALYFNPLFKSTSNHGYDTADYYKVDPRFGTNEGLIKLVAHAHELGWHVILDGVFNHTSSEFAPFQDVVKHGEKSKYKDWYHIKQFPLKVEAKQETYVSWGDSPNMPVLNVLNPEVQQYLTEAAAFWHKEAKIDGWRLDAGKEVNHAFWKVFRKAIKAVAPNAYLVGEIWENARDWLQGDEFDAVTNYRWRGATYAYFCNDEMTPTDFSKTLDGIRADYGDAVHDTLLNMLSSHDAERLRSRCGDPLRIGQCVLFQMTYPGVPCIYYGDEIGMDGANDPDNRGAIPWDEKQWDKGLRDFHKRLIHLRREHIVLRRGDYQTAFLHDQNRLFGYLRRYKDEHALVLFNSSDSPQCVALPLELLGGKPYHDWLDTGVTLETEGKTAQIALPARGLALLGN